MCPSFEKMDYGWKRGEGSGVERVEFGKLRNDQGKVLTMFGK